MDERVGGRGKPAAGNPFLLTFAEAEAVGARLHDHWEKWAGAPPMARGDLGWADFVQQALRFARERVAAREAPAEEVEEQRLRRYGPDRPGELPHG